MAKYKMNVALSLEYDMDTDEHADELHDAEIDVEDKDQVADWVRGCLEDDVTEFGTPSIDDVRLEPVNEAPKPEEGKKE